MLKWPGFLKNGIAGDKNDRADEERFVQKG